MSTGSVEARAKIKVMGLQEPSRSSFPLSPTGQTLQSVLAKSWLYNRVGEPYIGVGECRQGLRRRHQQGPEREYEGSSCVSQEVDMFERVNICSVA